ncbi:hypothetical protein CEUSTIGMA_g8762.t1 [Chlamydomonas eustigma]|uniref:Guanylate cyclase domain-containing protein n=1 Tax=Chlamydomonas eustigma TaxID=1157962 RepID=A0A250XE54_9CHLO|nr:hypothetical protein CEUSTIGMA_g8762.t1 [Chlamydomonas eustigma]|eukprot:GAX81331.1 hypothetical protein CEUSTIGMA_g8762.t1 [Chlamydomonas eustigma]
MTQLLQFLSVNRNLGVKAVANRHHLWYTFALIVKIGLFIQGTKLTIRGGTIFSWSGAYAFITLFGSLKAAVLWYLTLANLIQHDNHDDWKLMDVAFLIPINNVLGALAMPALQTSKNWTGFCAVLMLLGTLVAQIPPAHLLFQWTMNIPIIMSMDYAEACVLLNNELSASGSPLPACLSANHVLSYLYHTGFQMLALSLLTTMLTSIMLIKYKKRMAGELLDKTAHSQRLISVYSDSKAPLVSIGWKIFSRLGMDELLLKFNVLCEEAADKIPGNLVMWLLCMPIALYYFVSTLVLRHYDNQSFSKAHISHEEFLLVMAIFYLIGRDTCNTDIDSIMLDIKSRLKTSLVILTDVLPFHVVADLLRATSTGLSEVGSLEADTLLPQSSEDAGPFSEVKEITGYMGLPPVTTPRKSYQLMSEGSLDFQTANIMNTTSTHQGFKLSPQGSVSYGGIEEPLSLQRKTSKQSSHMSTVDLSDLMKITPRRNSISSKGLSPRHPPSSSTARGSPRLVAEKHECLTIFFSDIVGFSSWAHSVTPHKVMDTLNKLYTRLDDILINEMPRLYKVETIGDAYMVAANLVVEDSQHAASMVRFAIRAQEEAGKVLRPDVDDGSNIQLRIGIHSGPAMSGIIGKIRRRFCLFGDTINMASRTETSCPPGQVQLTVTTYQLAVEHLSGAMDPELVLRGPVAVKGSSEPINMYLAQPRDLGDAFFADLNMSTSSI